jgi:hypothetical protein
MARTGKIARLPRDIRNRLNRRLSDGEPGRRILQWLNALPEVRAILLRDFDDRQISEQNLCQWKQGGYSEWLTQQDILARAAELAGNATEINEISKGRMSDHLATLLVARYSAEFAAWDGADPDELARKLRALRILCHDIAELRRGDHEASRIDLERTRLERDRDKTDRDAIEYFARWIEYPRILDCIRDPNITPEDRAHQLREIFELADRSGHTPLTQAAVNGET